MNINRHNYEEFFLLYADNELPAAHKKAVEDFVRENEDLRSELEMLLQTTLSSDECLVFEGKEALLKPITLEGEIRAANYEEFFVLYADDELNNREKALVEEFVYRNPQYQQEFELLQKVKLEPETAVVYNNKAALYRKEENEGKVIVFSWWRVAVAAAIVLLVGVLWLNNKQTITPVVKVTAPSITPPENPTNNNRAQNNPEKTANTAVVNDKQKSLTAVTKEINPPYNNQKQTKKNIEQNVIGTVVENPGQLKEDVTIDNKSLMNDPGIKAATVTDGVKPMQDVVNVSTSVKAPVSTNLIDEPAVILNPDEKTINGISYASAGETDNLTILNSSVTKKNSLRGIIRKASRFVTKRTNNEEGEKGKRRSILIGNFEIAAD